MASYLDYKQSLNTRIKPINHYTSHSLPNNNYAVSDKNIRLNRLYYDIIVEHHHVPDSDYSLFETHYDTNKSEEIEFTHHADGSVYTCIYTHPFLMIKKANDMWLIRNKFVGYRGASDGESPGPINPNPPPDDPGPAPTTDPFVIIWRHNNDAIIARLPMYLDTGMEINVMIDWGDGSAVEHVWWEAPEHTYPAGIDDDYTISITGTLNWFDASKLPIIEYSLPKSYLVGVTFWGNVGFKRLSYAIAETGMPVTLSASDGDDAFDTVQNMTGMFKSLDGQPDVSDWNVSNVVLFKDMFLDVTVSATIDTSSWVTTNATDMSGMFESTDMLPDMSSWDTSGVTTFKRMFLGNGSDPDISVLDITGVTANVQGLLFFGEYGDSSSFSTTNYDAALISFAGQLPIQADLQFSAPDTKYTAGGAAETARQALVSGGWIITDAGAV